MHVFIYRWIANYLKITNIRLIIFCIQHVKSSIKSILSKIFEQNVDYKKVVQLFILYSKNDDISRKTMKS